MARSVRGRIGDRSAQQSGECELLIVVEVELAAEEDHPVGQQSPADLADGSRIEVASERDAVDSGTDSAAQLRHGKRRCFRK